ncbi:NEDD8 ultimate buster 1-like [Schistocerca piceifrons]|uniref:NEDD8 ultimate buster 1-like n=1 Tax=Schistocerca piceifrons TaxID=274613 RepID=UPI001F5F5A37|nr:NEDD8 ultimate buster 1-like [Schistocerca piceifrons]
MTEFDSKLTMDSELRKEGIVLQIREKLNEDKIKLWLTPFYREDQGCVEAEVQRLAEKYSKSTGLDQNTCLSVIKELQSHALQKLQERTQFQESGIATLKVRVSKNRKIHSVKIRLTDIGHQLLEAVASELQQPLERLKLISNGRIIQENRVLSEQSLQNGSMLLCLLLERTPAEIKELESRHTLLETTKADAQLLAGRSNDEDDYYVQIADQSGNMLKLPASEQKALIVAMSLHEKGRAAMKESNYSLALLLLLEADREFSNCHSQILQSVDNYALLNLDIAWCYLCLQNVTQIPDAEERLKKCEQSFHKSYGPNLERLMLLKGTTGTEAVLFMRLHLLQAIVLYHKNKRTAAAALLKRVENEISNLKIDDASLGTLLELGYTNYEARLGLRATCGNVAAAVEFLSNRRTQKEEVKKKEAAERHLNRERRKLGKCIDGEQFVDPQLHKSLMSMGFARSTAREALRQTNNNLTQSLDLIREKPHLFMTPSQEDIQQIVSMGFDAKRAKLALKKHQGDVEKAVATLVSSDATVNSSTNNVSDSSDESSNSNNSSSNPSTSSSSQSLQREEELKAYERLSEGISSQEHDEYLDSTLEQEEAFLRQYKALLSDDS